MGNYTQFRISGSGYGDDALEGDLARVKLAIDILGDVAANRASPFDTKWTFDYMVFTKTSDYLCYIEAVALMYEENILKHCSFVDDPRVFQKNQYGFNTTDNRFLSEKERSTEIFIVIDNTEWPEALKDPQWTGPAPYNEKTENTVFIEMHINTYYTSTARHQAVIGLFSIIIMVEIFLFFAAGVTYIYQIDQLAKLEVASKYSKLKEVIKEDNDYENILKEEITKLGLE